MTPIPLSRCDFINPVNMKGGGTTGLTVGHNGVTELTYDLDTLTIKVVRSGETERVPTGNVKGMRFIADAKKPEPVAAKK